MEHNNGAHQFGDWDIVGALTGNMTDDIEKAGKIAIKQVGLKAERLAVKYIHRQPGTWPPLAPATLERKKGRGKMLIDTNTLVSNITSYPVKPHQVFAGVRRKVQYTNKEGNPAVADIAAIMEYGSEARNIPKRPVWRPVYVHMAKWIPESGIFAKTYFKLFGKEYSSNGD